MSLALGLGAAGLALSGASSIGNFWQQHQNLQYQQGLQQDIFSREDNSIRRRVADLKAAGLSPVLAAGQGASAGQAIRTDPPQIEGNPLQDAMNLIRQKEEISNTQAQRDLINSQTTRQGIENKIARKDLKRYNETGLNPRSSSSIAKQISDVISGVSSPIGQSVKKEIKSKLSPEPYYIPKPKNANDEIRNLRYKLQEAQK